MCKCNNMQEGELGTCYEFISSFKKNKPTLLHTRNDCKMFRIFSVIGSGGGKVHCRVSASVQEQA